MDGKRKQAVEAVLRNAMTQIEAAAAFGVCRNTIGRWVREYQKDAEESFIVDKGGRPSISLPANLLPLLAEAPHLWTVETVASLLPQPVSTKTASRLLTSLGIVQPRILLPQDAAFIAIHAKANKFGARLFWYREAILEDGAYLASIAAAPRGDIAFMVGKDCSFTLFLSRLLLHSAPRPFHLLIPGEAFTAYKTEFDAWKDENPGTGCKVIKYDPPADT